MRGSGTGIETQMPLLGTIIMQTQSNYNVHVCTCIPIIYMHLHVIPIHMQSPLTQTRDTVITQNSSTLTGADSLPLNDSTYIRASTVGTGI